MAAIHTTTPSGRVAKDSNIRRNVRSSRCATYHATRPGKRYGPHNVTWGSSAKATYGIPFSGMSWSPKRYMDWRNEYRMAMKRGRS